MKLPYAVWRVTQREEWHKFYITDFEGKRRAQLDAALARLSGDWMIKRRTRRMETFIYAILIAEDDDFLMMKMAFKFHEHEYHGKKNWSRYYPRRKYRQGYIREPRPMAE